MYKRLNLLLVASTMLAACATPMETPEKYQSVTRFQNEDVYVARIEEAQTADGTRKLAVYGGAAVTYDQVVKYRVDWYDQDNFPIKTAVSSWDRIALDGNGLFQFSVVAPGPRAQRYIIEFQTE